MKFALSLCLTLLVAVPAWASRVSVQVGNHANFGRVVVSLGSTAPASVRQHGTQIDVVVSADDEVVAPEIVPRNVLSVVGGTGNTHLTVISGARIKSKQEGRTLLIDVFDPAVRARNAVLSAGSRPNPGKPPAASERQVATKPLMPDLQVAPPPSNAAAPSKPIEPAPASVMAAPTPSEPISPARPTVQAFSVSAGGDTGVAAFRQGGLGIIVFDDSVMLADPAERENALMPTTKAIQHGTLMTVPLAENDTLALTRSDGGLTVTIAPAVGTPAAMTAVPAGVQFQIAKPGRVMAISDPLSGQTMLIGTTRQLNGQDAMVDVGRAAPGYTLLRTWLGLALDASSDEIDLKVSESGYTLGTADGNSAIATAAARLDNLFRIPIAPTPVLVRQMNAQVASAAAAPPRGRGPDRVAAARTMLALGMSAEAEALLALAAADDPSIAQEPSTAALIGIAAVLAGRPAEATGLDNPALATGGDVAMWRGLRDLADGKPAAALAGAWPLLPAYPDAIRRQIAPPVIEAAAENGADVPAVDMQGPSLAYARAIKLKHDGQIDAALAALTAVRDGRDERDSFRAAVALAELRFGAGKVGAADTAEQLDRQSVRWRGDRTELSLRLRVAELKSEAGQWRAALDMLRDSQALFPDSKAKLSAARTNVFRSLLADGAKVAPLEMVLIAGDYGDGLQDSEEGDRLAGLLADKLAALDLPTRAVPVLKSLVDRTQSPIAKAEYGLRLAQMELEAGDAAAAAALLSSLDSSGLAASREQQLTILLAKAKAGQGDFAGAASALLTLSTPEVDEMRATYYARAGDWQRSLETLDGIVTAQVPETGDLTEQQQDIVLREATAAVQAGNADALRRLARFDRRMRPPRADLFRVLTASAVKGPEDLPRAARELAMSKTLPDRLNALKLR